MRYSSPDDIEKLIRGFENHTLPYSEWTHQAHMIVAMWYLIHPPGGDITETIREGIRSYNVACGVKNTDTSGYHETITIFWIWVIRRYLSTKGNESIVDLANDMIGRYDKSFPLEYYSRDLLMSSDARRLWREPDLKPLD